MKKLIMLAVLATTSLAIAGDNETKLCRGNANHGKVCTSIADCPSTDSGGATPLCNKLGHPSICSNRRYCAVSTSTVCEDNFDCPGTYNFTDPTDLCVFGPPWDLTYNPKLLISCTSDTDCKECTTGAAKGRACSSDANCYTGVCGAPGTGVCYLGAQQSQYEGNFLPVAGNPYDLTADAILSQRTIEDAPGFVDATVLAGPSSVFFDAHDASLWIKEDVRVTRRSDPFSVDMAADLVLCQPDFSHEEDETSPGDVSIGLGLPTRRSCGWSYWGGVWVSHTGAAAGAYVMERSRFKVFGTLVASGEAATKAFGVGNLDGTTAGSFQLTEKSGIPAGMDRCVGGANIGLACTLEADCPSSSCKTTVCVPATDFHRVACWRDAGGAATGANPDFVLCQPDTSNSSNTPNYEGSVTAKGCLYPHAVAFNPLTGEIWVADAGNNRAIKFPANATSGTAATRVVGASDLVSTGTTMNFPEGIAVSVSGRLAVGDTFFNRVQVWSSSPSSNGQAPTSYMGQPNSSTFDAGLSSGGVKCDRLSQPKGISWDGDRLWVADFLNDRAYRFNTPLVTGSGDTAVNSALQGQVTCAATYPRVDGAHMSLRPAGIADTGTRLMVTDTAGNRVAILPNLATAHVGEPTYEAVLGQATVNGSQPNRGGAAAANTLKSPTGIAYAPAFLAPARLYVADTANNRVLGYNGTSWSTGQAADIVFGQGGSFITTASGGGALGLNAPRGLAVDIFGNLYVADAGNGRVLVFCMGGNGGIDKTGGGSICTNANSGDATPDMVIGKTSYTAVGCDCTRVSGWCTTTTASTLCNPVGVRVDSVNNIHDIRVIVADDSGDFVFGGQGAQSGRVLKYQPITWPEFGVAASIALGPRPLVGQELTSYGKWGIGTCESTSGVSQNLECFYSEPSGLASTGGIGTGAKTCVGSSNPNTACTVNADCPGGTCGCPSGGYCLYRRQVGSLYGIAYDTTNQIIYVGRQGGLAQFINPMASNAPSKQVGLKGTAHAWERGEGYGSFVENSFAGAPVNAQVDLDSNLDLYFPGGPFYGGGMLWFNDPAPPPPTATVTQTRTITQTRTVTNTLTPTPTPSNTATITLTPTGVLPSTPTKTGTQTNTATGTPTSTPANSNTPTGTATPGGATSTATLVPSTSTPTPFMAHEKELNAEGFTIPDGSDCIKTKLPGTDFPKWTVLCGPSSNAWFLVKVHIYPSMGNTLLFTPMVVSPPGTGSGVCWGISNAVNVPNDPDEQNGRLYSDLLLGDAHTFTTPVGAPTTTAVRSDPTLVRLFNARDRSLCVNNTECDNATAWVAVRRVLFGACDSVSTVQWDQAIAGWPDL